MFHYHHKTSAPSHEKPLIGSQSTLRTAFDLSKNYPMIKCNINQATKEKIYHLPFDQQYDRTKIVPTLGEFYAQSVAEAESKGFRRAWRHTRPFAS